MNNRVSVAQVLRDELPADATGVRWVDNRWTECRACLESTWWRELVHDSDEPVGLVLRDSVVCDSCAEDARSREADA